MDTKEESMFINDINKTEYPAELPVGGKTQMEAIGKDEVYFENAKIKELIGILLAYVDDLACFSKTPVSDLNNIKAKLLMDDPALVMKGVVTRYVGNDLSIHDNNDGYQFISLTMNTYMDGLKELIDSFKLTDQCTLTLNDSNNTTEQELLHDDQSKFSLMSLIGKLGWLANCRPELAFMFSKLS
jgi:hypothetical protein